MGTVYNIRGTNGSGKSTLVRHFLPDEVIEDKSDWGGPVDLVSYDAPTKREPHRRLWSTGYINQMPDNIDDPIGVVGPYKTACGGMDALPSFEVQQDSVLRLLNHELYVPIVLAEGVLASTVYGSWGAFADRLRANPLGHTFAFIYLQTPIEVCLERIKARQQAAGREKPIKEELVRDKVRATAATRMRALREGQVVYDLPYGDEVEALTYIVNGGGESYRADA